jgi:hypothetical protein
MKNREDIYRDYPELKALAGSVISGVSSLSSLLNRFSSRVSSGGPAESDSLAGVLSQLMGALNAGMSSRDEGQKAAARVIESIRLEAAKIEKAGSATDFDKGKLEAFRIVLRELGMAGGAGTGARKATREKRVRKVTVR